MTAFERTIAAPPAAVWTVVADFARIAEWATAVDHSSTMTAQAEGVGAGRRVQVGSTVLLEKVVEWEPEQTLAYELVGLPPIVQAVVNRWTLASDGPHTTVRLECDVTPGPRPPMRLAARALGRRMGATNRTLVDDLAATVEGSTS